MALVRKGARRIVVEGVAYRWRVRRKPSYSQGNGWRRQSYAVEAEVRPGMTLVVETDRAHPGNWFGRPSGPVRPADVAASIRAARRRGWDPGAQGSPFILDLAAAGPEGQEGQEAQEGRAGAEPSPGG